MTQTPAYTPPPTTPLIEAVQRAKLADVEKALQDGADVEFKGGVNESTALIIASGKYSSAKIIALLLENGADVNATNRYGYTPLIVAARDGRADIINQLLEAGAEIEAQGQGGHTALSEAVRHGNLYTLRALIDRGAKIDRQDNFGAIPLFHAAYRAEAGSVTALLEAGADINARDRDGATPLMWAINLEEIEYMEQSLEELQEGSQEEVEARDRLEEEKEAKVETINLLIVRGADMALKNNEGKTARDMAVEGGYEKAVEILDAAAAARLSRLHETASGRQSVLKTQARRATFKPSGGVV